MSESRQEWNSDLMGNMEGLAEERETQYQAALEHFQAMRTQDKQSSTAEDRIPWWRRVWRSRKTNA